eukprot:3141421-Amphidinium_carterae.1
MRFKISPSFGGVPGASSQIPITAKACTIGLRVPFSSKTSRDKATSGSRAGRQSPGSHIFCSNVAPTFSRVPSSRKM